MTMVLVRQESVTDCGAACLAMIARHHGHELSLAEARTLTHTDETGASLYDLVRAGQELGWKAGGLSGTTNDLVRAVASGEVHVPLIAHVRESQELHFVVVHAISHGVVDVADPDRGFRTLIIPEFGRWWTGHLATFDPGEKSIVDGLRSAGRRSRS